MYMKKIISIFIITLLLSMITGCASSTLKFNYTALPYEGGQEKAHVKNIKIEDLVKKKINNSNKMKVKQVSFLSDSEFERISKKINFSESSHQGKYFSFKQEKANEEEVTITDKLDVNLYEKKAISFINSSGLNYSNLNKKGKVYEQLTKQKLPNVKKGTTEPDMTTAAEPEILTMGVVFYQNNTDETVLEGNIPNIDLSIDYTGNVVGVSGEWYNITSRNEVDTISTDSVIERIKSTDSRTYLTKNILEDDDFTVNEVEVVYYCNSSIKNGDVILPHFKLKGKNKLNQDASITVCAVDSEQLNIVD